MNGMSKEIRYCVTKLVELFLECFAENTKIALVLLSLFVSSQPVSATVILSSAPLRLRMSPENRNSSPVKDIQV